MKASACKRIIAFVCCLVLAASLVPCASLAYALGTAPDAPAGEQASVVEETNQEASENGSDTASDDQTASLDDQAMAPDGSNATSEDSSATTNDLDEAPEEAEAPETSLESAQPLVGEAAAQDVLEFVFVDQGILAVGATQTVAVAFKDASVALSSARLSLSKDGSAEAARTIEAQAVTGNAAGFSFSFDDEADCGAYALLAFECVLADGSSVSIDLSAAPAPDGTAAKDAATSMQAGAGSFEVVNADLAQALAESAERSNDVDDTSSALDASVAQDEAVTALVLDEGGNVKAAQTLEEALAEAPVADPAAEASAIDAAAADADEPVVVNDADVAAGSSADAATDAGSADTTTDATQTSLPDQVRSFLSSLFGTTKAYADVRQIATQSVVAGTREGYLIVAVDPGHGGTDSGANGNGLVEKSLTLDIAKALRDELNTYAGVSVVMTRETDTYVGLQERVNRAAAAGADVFVSVHINAAGVSTATGAEVWVPNDSSYNKETHTVGVSLGGKIAAQLKKLGLVSRGSTDGVAGVRVRNSENGGKYADGSIADYYAVINGSRKKGFPGIIVEHGFIDGTFDSKMLANATTRKKMGVADATGIAQQYSLGRESTAKAQALVSVKSCVDGLGWERSVHDGKVSGTEGKKFNMQALRLALCNAAASAGGIQYRVLQNGSWSAWVANDAVAGKVGAGNNIEAVQIRLTGSAANKYDVYYQAHVQKKGWMGWAKNGASAGTQNAGLRFEALKVVVVPKGQAAPGSTSGAFATGTQGSGSTNVSNSSSSSSGKPATVSYRTHVQTYGWETAFKSQGSTSGTVGKAKRLEGIQIKLNNPTGWAGQIQYRTHVQTYGWESSWKSSGSTSGTVGEAKRLEAIQIKLTGELANHYDVYYAVHTQKLGWQGWAKNGASAGTSGYGYRLEGIQIKLVPKGSAAPKQLGSRSAAYAHPTVSYKTHVQTQGWQANVHDGATSGTSGLAKRLEGIQIKLSEPSHSGSIEYRTHVQKQGWQNWRSDGALSGTSGKALRLEAICIRLTGNMASNYDVWYRVHAQTFGWMGWTKNGSKAGTAGYGKRLEAIQIKVVKKGSAAPGSQATPYRATPEAAEENLAIMGKPKTSAAQMARAYAASGKTYPSSVFTSKGAPTVQAFCNEIYKQAVAEGVRPEVLFAQVMVETGWLQFGGDVKASQCNFGGIGATGGGNPGNTFANVAQGLRAQAQHLKAYASTLPPVGTCYDPRFHFVSRGCAPEITDLGGRWAADPDYGSKLYHMVQDLLKR